MCRQAPGLIILVQSVLKYMNVKSTPENGRADRYFCIKYPKSTHQKSINFTKIVNLFEKSIFKYLLVANAHITGAGIVGME
jgi:hypothetical protein